MAGRLAGKKAVVTGAAMGIGAGIAQAFAAEGAQVVVTDLSVEAGLALARVLEAEFMPLDVGDPEAWLALEQQHPEVDVVVNNAGITGFEGGDAPQDVEHVSLAEWHRVHRVNLDGTLLGCQYAIRAMKRKGTGSIINMSSRSGLVGIPTAAAYASSKAAIRNHTKSVALYCAAQGWAIRCNSIHPAAIMTPMWSPMLGEGPEREANIAALVANTPLRRFGEVEEVAAVAVMLASDEARYMTGTEVTIDGGILAGSAAAPGRQREE